MKILDRIEQVRAALAAQGTTTSLHADFTDAALRATRGGITSGDWEDYMKLFADNEQQLKRLTGKEANAEDYVNVSSAYLVANGTCGGHSPQGTPLAFGIDPRIDEGLPDQPDGTIIRPIEI